MPVQFVKRGIVHESQGLSRDVFPLFIKDSDIPFFLLTGYEVIPESQGLKSQVSVVFLLINLDSFLKIFFVLYVKNG